jgi:hypothetical protein
MLAVPSGHPGAQLLPESVFPYLGLPHSRLAFFHLGILE